MQANSVSRIANRLGVAPAAVFRAVKELDIEPCLWLDDRSYYEEQAVEAIRAHLNGEKVEALAR